MKLWHLYPIDSQSGPWDPWYDKVFSLVVRAETERHARILAEEEAGDESWSGSYDTPSLAVWMNPSLTKCVELLPDGNADVVCRDFAKA